MHSCPYCGCPDIYLADTDGGGRTVACPFCCNGKQKSAYGYCWGYA
nr:MAG TPA: cysteine-rich protein [Caudoviricetes sp.]